MTNYPLTKLPTDADFVAIDFETANRDVSSACAIGLAFVKNGVIVASPSWLIRPPRFFFEPAFIKIHGIHPQDVEYQLSFAELWPRLEKYVAERPVVAHNAKFDINVLMGTLDHYHIARPNLKYTCTLRIARRTWPTWQRYNLAALGERHGITFHHHDAAEDAMVCAQVALKAFEHNGVNNFDQLNAKLKFAYGQVFPGGHTPMSDLMPNYDFTNFGRWETTIHKSQEQQSRIDRAAIIDKITMNNNQTQATINGYKVTLDACSCPDFTRRRKPCKHMYKLFFDIQKAH
ncbi:MAG: polymerase epsilon subunit-like 3-5 exonuclease [Firmicutes bacterium]|nr:polymerase epsilon subunit-like 3-5 exonuclease [Bacillota bacterium]